MLYTSGGSIGRFLGLMLVNMGSYVRQSFKDEIGLFRGIVSLTSLPVTQGRILH
jgi:hypothetical protein